MIAVAGYFSMYNETAAVVVERPPLANFSPDYCMLIASFGLSFVMFASLPINYNPFRNQLFLLFFKQDDYTNLQ